MKTVNEKPVPSALNLHKRSKELGIQFGDQNYRLPAEFLRVLSPSAEVRGHGKPVLQVGKLNVGIQGMERVGNYAIKLLFDDGHDSGIYDWGYLYDLCIHQNRHWEEYLRQLHEAGGSRDPEASVVRLVSH